MCMSTYLHFYAIHVHVHGYRSLLLIQPQKLLGPEDFGAFFGNKSDPYVVVRFGAEEKLGGQLLPGVDL